MNTRDGSGASRSILLTQRHVRSFARPFFRRRPSSRVGAPDAATLPSEKGHISRQEGREGRKGERERGREKGRKGERERGSVRHRPVVVALGERVEIDVHVEHALQRRVAVACAARAEVEAPRDPPSRREEGRDARSRSDARNEQPPRGMVPLRPRTPFPNPIKAVPQAWGCAEPAPGQKASARRPVRIARSSLRDSGTDGGAPRRRRRRRRRTRCRSAGGSDRQGARGRRGPRRRAARR